MKRTSLALALGALLALAAAPPAQATIHELVASWCSGNFSVLDPPGQSKLGTQSFVRALQASGLYDVQIGVVPAGQPAPAAGTTPVTVDIDFSRPNSKFADAGDGFFVFVDGPFTVYLEAGIPDHPAFARCTNSPF